MKPDFSPIPLAKIDKRILMTNYFYKKSAKFSEILTDFCSGWMFFSSIMRLDQGTLICYKSLKVYEVC